MTQEFVPPDLAAQIVEALGQWWLRADDPLRSWHETQRAQTIVRACLASAPPPFDIEELHRLAQNCRDWGVSVQFTCYEMQQPGRATQSLEWLQGVGTRIIAAAEDLMIQLSAAQTATSLEPPRAPLDLKAGQRPPLFVTWVARQGFGAGCAAQEKPALSDGRCRVVDGNGFRCARVDRHKGDHRVSDERPWQEQK